MTITTHPLYSEFKVIRLSDHHTAPARLDWFVADRRIGAAADDAILEFSTLASHLPACREDELIDRSITSEPSAGALWA